MAHQCDWPYRVAAGRSGRTERLGTPGLPPEVADPMRSWSLHATKLLLVMGLHGGGDTLNSAAELNAHGHDGQMACAPTALAVRKKSR